MALPASEHDIRADERKRIADVLDEVAAGFEHSDADRAVFLRELASVLRTDREELIQVELMAIADEIIAERDESVEA